jgi:hypothetical protein
MGVGSGGGKHRKEMGSLRCSRLLLPDDLSRAMLAEMKRAL